MIDSVGVYIPTGRPLTNPKGELIKSIPGPYETSKPLSVGFRHGYVRISGSLPKFWKGHNVTPLSADELEESLDFVAQAVGPEFLQARVGQLEIGTTIAVEHRPQLYILPWKSFGRYHWSCQMDGETVEIGNRSQSFTGYDKGLECRFPLPRDAFPRGRGLRLEMRIRKSRVFRGLVGKPLWVRDLTDPRLMELLKEKWRSFYFRIPKSPKPFSSLDGLTAGQVRSALAYVGLEYVGWNNMRGLVKEAQEAGRLKKTSACRIRETLEEVLEAACHWEPDSLVSELDHAVWAA